MWMSRHRAQVVETLGRELLAILETKRPKGSSRDVAVGPGGFVVRNGKARILTILVE